MAASISWTMHRAHHNALPDAAPQQATALSPGNTWRDNTMELFGISYLLLLICVLLTGCASGSSIVVGNVRDPIDPDQVRIFLEPPRLYEIIGIVKASSDAGWTAQGSVDYAMAELKNQAAKLGANGILLETSGQSNSIVVGADGSGQVYAIPVTEQAVTGKAIYVVP